MTKSSNFSLFAVPSTSWTSCMPSRDITAIPEYITPLARSCGDEEVCTLHNIQTSLCCCAYHTLSHLPKQALQGHILRFRHECGSTHLRPLQSYMLYFLMTTPHKFQGCTNCRNTDIHTKHEIVVESHGGRCQDFQESALAVSVARIC